MESVQLNKIFFEMQSRKTTFNKIKIIQGQKVVSVTIIIIIILENWYYRLDTDTIYCLLIAERTSWRFLLPRK